MHDIKVINLLIETGSLAYLATTLVYLFNRMHLRYFLRSLFGQNPISGVEFQTVGSGCEHQAHPLVIRRHVIHTLGQLLAESLALH